MAEDDSWIARLLPRYRYGVISPGSGGVQRGVDYQFYQLVPTDVMQLGIGLGVRDYSAGNVTAAMSAFWTCVEALREEGADCVMLSGVPVSAALGRDRILQLSHEVPARTGLAFDATLEAIVAALQSLGASRVVMGSRFPSDTNRVIADYLAEAGVHVLASTEREISLAQARQLSMRDGMQLALEVGREAARLAPEAEAILLPGGATLSLHAIPALEAELGKPVLVNLSAEIWHALICTGVVPPVKGWGRLLESGH
jgi:maleate cis-trans isomerase